MRATIERPVVLTNTWGEAEWSETQAFGPIVCRVWSDPAKVVIDGDKIASVGGYRAVFPLSAGVQVGDRIMKVTDRLGKTLFSGPLAVKMVVRRPGHLSVEFESHVA